MSKSRNERGHFAPGNDGGPGRSKGLRNKRTVLEEVLIRNEEKTVTTLSRLFEEGNSAAVAVIGKWQAPRRGWRPDPVDLPPPKDAKEVREQLASLVSRFLAGEIDEVVLHGYVEASKIIIDARSEELEDLVRRVVALRGEK